MSAMEHVSERTVHKAQTHALMTLLPAMVQYVTVYQDTIGTGQDAMEKIYVTLVILMTTHVLTILFAIRVHTDVSAHQMKFKLKANAMVHVLRSCARQILTRASTITLIATVRFVTVLLDFRGMGHIVLDQIFVIHVTLQHPRVMNLWNAVPQHIDVNVLQVLFKSKMNAMEDWLVNLARLRYPRALTTTPCAMVQHVSA
ncbi:uncharacterized protein LOC132720447 [Ruditapes philippinarum]|uniref:uncharacterized protein LOC132720447 n=1 Tax=Ruditapes philippinarum TaxID=129788 RepID=UPI00295BC289|nr:uncharacterized protein LOC132720447 [Ruditapes philippinarum]